MSGNAATRIMLELYRIRRQYVRDLYSIDVDGSRAFVKGIIFGLGIGIRLARQNQARRTKV